MSDDGIKDIKVAKNKVKSEQISQEMLVERDTNIYSVQIIEFMKYFHRLSKDKNIQLKTVRFCESEQYVFNQFAKGLASCVGIFYHSIYPNNENEVNQECQFE